MSVLNDSALLKHTDSTALIQPLIPTDGSNTESNPAAIPRVFSAIGTLTVEAEVDLTVRGEKTGTLADVSDAPNAPLSQPGQGWSPTQSVNATSPVKQTPHNLTNPVCTTTRNEGSSSVGSPDGRNGSPLSNNPPGKSVSEEGVALSQPSPSQAKDALALNPAIVGDKDPGKCFDGKLRIPPRFRKHPKESDDPGMHVIHTSHGHS